MAMTFYHVFKTTCLVDGSAYFGIRGNPDPEWGSHMDYFGTGRKLKAKMQQFPPNQFRAEVLYTTTSIEAAERFINNILTPATYADPRCLNISPEEFGQTMSEALKDVPKADLHKATIGLSMQDNQNRLGHVVSEETKEALSETRTNANLKWIHNIDTREEMQLPADELNDDGTVPITGFKLGRLPKKLKKLGPVKQQMKSIHEIPPLKTIEV